MHTRIWTRLVAATSTWIKTSELTRWFSRFSFYCSVMKTLPMAPLQSSPYETVILRTPRGSKKFVRPVRGSGCWSNVSLATYRGHRMISIYAQWLPGWNKKKRKLKLKLDSNPMCFVQCYTLHYRGTFILRFDFLGIYTTLSVYWPFIPLWTGSRMLSHVQIPTL